jgi:hypothetical protein
MPKALGQDAMHVRTLFTYETNVLKKIPHPQQENIKP